MNEIVHDCTFENCPNRMLPPKIAKSLLRVFVFIGCIVKPKPNRIVSNDNEHNEPRKNQKISFTKDASFLCSRYLSCHAMLCDDSRPEFWKLSIISRARPSVHTNPSRKRRFSKTLKPQTREIWKSRLCVVTIVMWLLWTSFLQTQMQNGRRLLGFQISQA